MRRLSDVIILLVSLSITWRNVCAQDGTECNTPDGRQSKCIRLQYCDSFSTILRNSGGKPPPADAENIRRHLCRGNFVCCPDNAVSAPTLITPSVDVAPKPQPADPMLPPLTDFNELKNHRNFDLINGRGCGSSSVDRIVGGTKASPGELPWMALLQFKSRLGDSFSFNCGGALISNYYVLTAAHCVTRDLVAVRLGEHDLSTMLDCSPDGTCQDPVQDIPIESAFRHKQYDNRKKTNDIALLRLKNAADTTKRNVKTICLPTTEESQIDQVEKSFQDHMLISGWGRVESGMQSDVLMKAHVPFVPNNKCIQKFAPANVRIYETYLCAGGINKTDACNGDSGGPIQTAGFINGRPKMILYGVVSVGVECLNPQVIYPGIYTNVAHYLDWILDHMKP